MPINVIAVYRVTRDPLKGSVEPCNAVDVPANVVPEAGNGFLSLLLTRVIRLTLILHKNLLLAVA